MPSPAPPSPTELLLALILNAPRIISDQPLPEGEIIGPDGRIYTVYRQIYETNHFSLRLCGLPDGKKMGFLKAAKTVEDNALLDREALILRLMSEEAAVLDADRPEGKKLYYQDFFPFLVDSFEIEDQDGRRVSILGLPQMVKKPSGFSPVSTVQNKDRSRIDPKTSAWIMGKVLKILILAHDLGISCGNLSADNILIDRAEHLVFVFDWTNAVLHANEEVPADTVAGELCDLGITIIAAMGGNPLVGTVPDHPQLTSDIRVPGSTASNGYAEHLKQMADGLYSSIREAFTTHYRIVYGVWPRGFYPYTAIPLDGDTTGGESHGN